MSEAYDPTEDGTESDESGGALTSSPLGVLPGQSAGNISPDLPIAALQQATARLKAQRSGLSPQQQIAALLIGYGKPNASGTWQAGVSGAAQSLLDQQTAARKADQARQDLIAKYDLASAHYQAQNQASEARTAELAQAAKDRAAAAGQKASQGTLQVLPALYPGATPSAVLKGFDKDGTPFVRPVPIGTPGSTPVDGLTPPAAGGAPTNPFPVKYGTGAELAQKYGITGLTPETNYALNTTGPDAGKTTEVKTQDYLSQYGGATGPSLLAQLPESDRAQIELIARGKVAPPTAGTRSPVAQRILALAAAAYPGVDFAKNYRTTIDYAPSGKSGQNIIKGGTAIDHAVKLYDTVDALGNVDAGPLSGVVNGVKNAVTASNNPAVKTFDTNRDLFVKEVEAAVKGTGNSSSLAEFKNWQRDVNNADLPDVIKDVIKRGVGLLGDRLQNQVEPYNQTLGTNRSFLSWLPPSAQASFIKINPDYALTDDDKNYLMEQEAARRQKATTVAAPKAAAPGPSSATGGKALPATTVQQYASVPFANKAAARAHLQSLGYDVSGLK